jgi:hypothetical protein
MGIAFRQAEAECSSGKSVAVIGMHHDPHHFVEARNLEVQD